MDETTVDITPTVTSAGPSTPSNQPGWTLTEADVSATMTQADARPVPPASDPPP